MDNPGDENGYVWNKLFTHSLNLNRLFQKLSTMKSCFSLLAAILVCHITTGIAQEPAGSHLYMPLDIRKGYDEGTRSWLGIPGKNYWDNTCSYKIDASMDIKTRTLTGREGIEYKNNSPDTLKNIVINTYLDVYRRGSQRASRFDAETNGFSLSLITVNGETIDSTSLRRMTTFYNILLSNPLLPHSSCIIGIEWTVDFVMPAFAREGFADSTSAFIGYWYPKIAVYDDLFGWNTYTYTLKDEFYSPLADYDVTISLPEGYLVWATGILQNRENLTKPINDRITLASKSSGPFVVIDSTMVPYSKDAGHAPWRFRADSVPDFAFAFTDHYLWVASVAESGDRKVFISTVYPKEKAVFFGPLNNLVKQGLEFYSSEDPGVAFPYPCFTTFSGLPESGMEFPMMSFEGEFRETNLDADVAIHEMLHSYMPFLVRTNETRYGWMDEGITSFYTMKAELKLGLDFDYLRSAFRTFYGGLDGSGNLPLLTPTINLTGANGGGMQYIKPVDMLNSLEDLVGAKSWRECYQAFTNAWKYKSPITYDFIFFTGNYLKDDLSWFWDAWFMHFGFPDLDIVSVDKEKVVVENRGGLPIPFTLVEIDNNGNKTEKKFHADFWKENSVRSTTLAVKDPVFVEIKCDPVEDYDPTGNVWQK
jgi:hypothetical protein